MCLGQVIGMHTARVLACSGSKQGSFTSKNGQKCIPFVHRESRGTLKLGKASSSTRLALQTAPGCSPKRVPRHRWPWYRNLRLNTFRKNVERWCQECVPGGGVSAGALQRRVSTAICCLALVWRKRKQAAHHEHTSSKYHFVTCNRGVCGVNSPAMRNRGSVVWPRGRLTRFLTLDAFARAQATLHRCYVYRW